jgi:dihydroxyacetone kinase-like predicted kinase
MRSLSGHSFADGLRSGAYAVVKGQAALDRINVFPVADADTGANLAATLTAAAAGLGRTPPTGIGMAARLAADAALIGARGNSGAIFAQFLHGLAEGLRQKHDVIAGEFAVAAAEGVESAYLAVQHPREGTILSVLKAWARELRASAEQVPDFRDVMAHALEAARVALAATPAQLQVLARNHVVDAGGQGFVYFLEGMLDPIKGHPVKEADLLRSLTFPAVYEQLAGTSGAPGGGFVASTPGRTGVGHDAEVDDTFRYCAEALLGGERLDRERIECAVGHLGGSLVIAGGSTHMRVHLHTNQPAVFRGALAEMASVESFKLDDMVIQQTAAKGATIALVTDSTVDLPEAAQLRLGMVMVPLTVTIGGKTYLDRVELILGFL